MNIRPLNRRDRSAIHGFFEQMSPESRNFFDIDGKAEIMLLNLLSGHRTDKRNYGMFSQEGELAGILMLWDCDKSVPWLSIAIAERYRSQGWGKKLISFAVREMSGEGKGGILLTTHIKNVQAQALYRHMGFERLGVHANGEELFLKRF